METAFVNWLAEVRRASTLSLDYEAGARDGWDAARRHFHKAKAGIYPCTRCGLPAPSGRKPRYDMPFYCGPCRAVTRRENTRRAIQALRERRRAASHA